LCLFVEERSSHLDEVRNWLHVRSGKTEFKNEQGLLLAVVKALYYFPEDRTKLLTDPLLRLLIDPPEGYYDFTIVSAMGVVTEGAKGTELETSYARLWEQRGVQAIRADTASGERLEFNARKIEEAIRKVKTPWGIIGYSQGCANSLMAESMLRGGTPEQQHLLKDFRCRNFIFSAINGSAHGSCGDEKLLRAMVEAENIIKYYQGVVSGRLIDLFLQNMRQIFDARFFIHLMGGMHSLSREGTALLGREGQFLPHLPSTTVRGVVSEEILPEALELLSHILTKQVGGALHDTQVTLNSAVGHPRGIINENTTLLKNCDMGSFPQHTHHWSPLLKETEFLTTERDLKRAIYGFPKDRHVFPWIEVNARFGIIERRDP